VHDEGGIGRREGGMRTSAQASERREGGMEGGREGGREGLPMLVTSNMTAERLPKGSPSPRSTNLEGGREGGKEGRKREG